MIVNNLVSLAVLSQTAQAFTRTRNYLESPYNSNYYDNGSCDINCYTHKNGNIVSVGTTSVPGSYQVNRANGQRLCVPSGFNVQSDISDSIKLAMKCSNLYAHGLNTGQCRPYCWAGSA